MPLWDDQERATLVALMRELPRAASWPGVVAEIIEAGSARSVWDAHHEQSLFDTDIPVPIAEAARQPNRSIALPPEGYLHIQPREPGSAVPEVAFLPRDTKGRQRPQR